MLPLERPEGSRPFVTLIESAERVLLVLGLLLASLLLITFGVSFSSLGWVFAGPFWLLVITSLVTIASHVFTAVGSQAPGALAGPWARLVLCIAIPIGFLASSLDCTGLSFEGCSSFCTFVKLIWIPIAAIASLLLAATARPSIALLVTAMSFVPLAPHCVCYNPGNSWWIDRLGKSPECYAWGFVVSTIAVGALWTGKRLLLSTLVVGLIIGGALTFFIAHHYLGFPW